MIKSMSSVRFEPKAFQSKHLDHEKYRLTYKWNCSEFDTDDDDLRPAYIEKANNNHIYRPGKLQYELHIPNAITRSGLGLSGVTVLFFVSLCVTAIFSCIIFRLWLSGTHKNIL